MDTPYTIRAQELRDIYSTLSMKYLTQDERLDVLLTLKHTVKEHDCKLTQEIIELIDREADLLMRGVKESNLEGIFISSPGYSQACFVKNIPASCSNDDAFKTFYFIYYDFFFTLYNLTPTALYRLSFVFLWKISDCLIFQIAISTASIKHYTVEWPWCCSVVRGRSLVLHSICARPSQFDTVVKLKDSRHKRSVIVR